MTGPGGGEHAAQESDGTTAAGGHDSADRRVIFAAVLTGLLVAPLPLLGDLRQQIPLYLALVTTATLVLYLLHYMLESNGIGLSKQTIFGVAIALRLLLLPMMPSLSDDAWRYLWDGRLLLHGVSPYHEVPSSPALAPFADELLALQGYPDTGTIYPPGVQLLFASAMAFAEATGSGYHGGYFFWKILLTAGELAGVWLLLLLLDRLQLPRRRAILYAWHPLVIVELAGQGHTDGLWVLSLAVMLTMFSRGSPVGTALGLSIGALTRLFTILLIPLWWKLSDSLERRAGAITLLVAALLALPLVEPRAFESFMTVGLRFTNIYEFNGGFYRLVKWLLDELHVAPSNRIAGAIGTVVQGGLFLLIWTRAARGMQGMLVASMAIVTTQLVFATKVHVWYFVAPLFLAVLTPRGVFTRAWLWVALAGPFTYLYYAAMPHSESLAVLILEWGGGVVLAGSGLLLSNRKRRPGS